MKTKYVIIAVVAALVVPLSWATATTSLQFNNNANDMVGVAPETISGAPGGTITLSLQVNSTVGTTGLDYWLSQLSGPASGVFSITGSNETGSAYPVVSSSDATVSSAGDAWNNNTGAPGADGIQDQVLNLQNGINLGATKSDTTTNNPTGVNQVRNFTLQISPTAATGTYELVSFDYPGFGWGSTTAADQQFDKQAAIFVNLSPVPEPATWSLVGLGGLASVGLGLFRARWRLG